MDLEIETEKVVITGHRYSYSVSLDYRSDAETLIIWYEDHYGDGDEELFIKVSEVGKDNLKCFLKEVLARLEGDRV